MENPSPLAPAAPARLRRAAAGLGAVAGLYLAAQGAVALPPVRAWARVRAADALRARVGEVALGAVGFDPLFRVVAGPLELGGAPGRPAVTIDRLRLRAAPLALLRGRVELASVRLHGVRVDASQPAALRDVLARRAGQARGAPPASRDRSWPRLHVRRLRVVLARPGGGETEVGPLDGDVWPDGNRIRADLRLPEHGRIAVDLRRDGETAISVRAVGLRPAALGSLAEALPVSFPAGALALEIDAVASPDLERAEASVRADVDGLVAAGARLAAGPVGPLHLAADARVSWDRREARMETKGTLAFGGALRAALEGDLRAVEGLPFSLSLRATRVSYSAFAAALPASLAPPEEAPHPPGDLDASLEVEGPLLSPGAWRLAADLDLSRMRAAARRAPPAALRGPFIHRPEEGSPFLVGPDNPNFVPLDELPEHVVRAVTTSEDAGFFAHSGFDFAELSIAMSEGLEAGRVVRGGSTITQQLAKNLWLSRDKVLARKVREALGTIALEATLPKERLLEIYLNVAEWGPGVFGIGPGARHWFGKDPRLLTAKEAAFLASVIPNPVRYDAIRVRGTISEGWEQRVSEILLHMSRHGALGDDDLLRALDEPLVFAGAPSAVTATPDDASLPAAGGGG